MGQGGLAGTRFQAHAHMVLAALFGGHVAGQLGREGRGFPVKGDRVPGQVAHQGQAENKHHDLGRGHLSGQPQDRLAASAAQDGGFAGTDRHAVGQDIGPQTPQGIQGVVPGPDRTAARQERQIVLGRGRFQGGVDAVQIVGHQGKGRGLGPGRTQHGEQGMGVDVADLARGRAGRDGHQFVAGGEHRHPGPQPNRHPGMAQGGQHADLLGAQPDPGREDPPAQGSVLTGQKHVVPRGHGPPDLDGSGAHILGVFDHDHGIGPGGQQCPGDDAGAAPGRQRLVGPRADGDVHGQVEISRVGFTGPEHLGRPHGIAVHGGPVGGGQILGRHDVLGQKPAVGLVQVNGFGAQWRKSAQQVRELGRGHGPEKTFAHI